ncbi:MAG: N-formylglutamate amidohydrolase [Hyphomicrobiales bacterium]
MGVVLLGGEDHPVITVNAKSDSPFVLVCEHAGRRIPQSLGTLGLLERDLTRHIAWDIGAEGVARNLAELLGAPLILQRYSRLLYDCNRPPDASDAIPSVSETTDIPANQKLTPEERLARIQEIYRPFHDALAAVLDERAAQGSTSVLVTIHSFTPIYKGVRRRLDLGILHDRDRRFADAMLAQLGSMKDILVRRNEPYGPEDGVCHTLNLHAGIRGLRHAMVEIRNDLIGEEAGQMAWAGKLADILTAASAAPADAGRRAAGAAS